MGLKRLQADEAAALEARNGALENMIREAKAQAEDARADSKKNEGGGWADG